PPTGDRGGRDNSADRGAHAKLTPEVIPPAQEPTLMDGELPRRRKRGKEMLSADATGGVRTCGQALPSAVTDAGGGEIPSVPAVLIAVGVQAKLGVVVVSPAE